MEPRISACRVVEDLGGCCSLAASRAFAVSVDVDVVLDDSGLADESENNFPIGYD